MNDKMAKKLAIEHLRGLRLTGSLENLGFDITDYQPQLLKPILEQLGINDATAEIHDIIGKYKEKVISMTFYAFIDGALEGLADEMIGEIKLCKVH